MKLRYNGETKEWDVVLRKEDYYRIMNELEALRRIVASQIKAVPHCSGDCFSAQLQKAYQGGLINGN